MKNILIINTGVFLSVAILHLMRAFYGWTAVVGGAEIGLGVSLLAVLLAGSLAWFNWRLVGLKSREVWLKLILVLLALDASAVLYSWSIDLTYFGLSRGVLLAIGLVEVVAVVGLAAYLGRVKKVYG
ncbi:MAG: hypothetical protein COV08_03505 [Candidatus Vogelbacteria bacterium CG10_big_fil_rev_8_21_14_0_10_49_38]|uniref:Uncharacterized protein n=1 Tax=Candidatus Vogelbacteria bacterium CG10_big_fil_rev_8_21_14_0_10_49_38 TaxID=1975043 RepID=A0A2H0RH17_9BACT|nr:MAG: hypothetical protein BK006_03495 [bacterium CG10_49_38]PIR45706.1 MAG: hypothetical protein COV08_03505 [Candidatus Vogelbacteria bacterium CG10_big_fil_rev_8_21_14_0_10_49_38]